MYKSLVGNANVSSQGFFMLGVSNFFSNYLHRLRAEHGDTANG